MAHTPGPWGIVFHGDVERIRLNGSTVYQVSDVTDPDFPSGQPRYCLDDLRLMAAAPELLDALYASLDSLRWLTEWRTHDDTICDQEIEYEIGRISKLIANAEGRVE